MQAGIKGRHMTYNPLSIYPDARETTLNGRPVTIRFGGHFASGVHSGSGSAPLNFESVRLVLADSTMRGTELPRFWREWDDTTLAEQLPNCRIFPLSDLRLDLADLSV